MKRLQWVLLLVVIAAVVGAAFVWFRLKDHAVDAAHVSLPEAPADAESLAEEFNSGGLVPLRKVAFDFPILHGDLDPSASQCRGAAAELNNLGSPEDLASLMLFVSDEATSDMYESYLGEAVEFLAECVNEAPSDQADLQFTSTVLRRQLESIGVKP